MFSVCSRSSWRRPSATRTSEQEKCGKGQWLVRRIRRLPGSGHLAETEGDVLMMTTYNITILSCLFALNLWSVLWPICVQEWNYIMWPYVYPSYVYNVCRRQSSGGQLMSWLSRAQRGASSRTHLYSSNESVQGSQQVTPVP